MKRPGEVSLRQLAAMAAQQDPNTRLIEKLQGQHFRQAVAQIHPVGDRHHLRHVRQEVVQIGRIETKECVVGFRNAGQPRQR